ncbi:MAG: glycosyltransferase family 4 protein [Rhodospirillaceae bacterium]|nr:glycosyltransferase family 4 protein [Rhodospirillales bacterium]
MTAATTRVLTFTTLYPNAAQPVLGVFVENRLRHLAASGEVQAQVVAPVPWFPVASPVFGQWGKYAGAPKFEDRHGLRIWHPRYPVLPKIGMTIAPALLYAWTLPLVRRLKFDVIDAHYFYPDGVAAAMLARTLGKKLVITARGTDLNLIPRYRLPRAQIRWAAQTAAGICTVCAALKAPLLEMGIPESKIRVLRNGVDLEGFRLMERAKPDATTLLSVGLLIERKGHHLVIEALTHLPGTRLMIAGGGPMRDELEALARRLGVSDRVRFLGEVPHDRLAEIYTSADALVLASSREGWANVLLEAMACGTPVVATDIWGTAEVVASPEAGVLVAERSAAAIAQGVQRLLAALPDRRATRLYAERFGWEPTTQGQLDMFREVLA